MTRIFVALYFKLMAKVADAEIIRFKASNGLKVSADFQ